MRKLNFLVIVAALCILPAAAHAEFLFEGSIGYGLQVSPSVATSGYNVMAAAGVGFLDKILRLELGVAVNRDQFAGTEYQLRPMVILAPPIIPFYIRGVVACADLFSSSRQFAYGAYLGAEFWWLFAEVGALPRIINGSTSWTAEARVGLHI